MGSRRPRNFRGLPRAGTGEGRTGAPIDDYRDAPALRGGADVRANDAVAVPSGSRVHRLRAAATPTTRLRWPPTISRRRGRRDHNRGHLADRHVQGRRLFGKASDSKPRPPPRSRLSSTSKPSPGRVIASWPSYPSSTSASGSSSTVGAAGSADSPHERGAPRPRVAEQQLEASCKSSGAG